MSTPDFSTAENKQELAQEVSCLKAMITLMLQAMGQADAGRVIIKMEKQISQMDDKRPHPRQGDAVDHSNPVPAESITDSRYHV